MLKLFVGSEVPFAVDEVKLLRLLKLKLLALL